MRLAFVGGEWVDVEDTVKATVIEYKSFNKSQLIEKLDNKTNLCMSLYQRISDLKMEKFKKTWELLAYIKRLMLLHELIRNMDVSEGISPSVARHLKDHVVSSWWALRPARDQIMELWGDYDKDPLGYNVVYPSTEETKHLFQEEEK